MSTVPTPAPSADGLIAKLAAFVIERSCKNYVTTIIGLLVGVAGAISSFAGVIPPEYQAPAASAAALAGAIALALSKDS